MGGPSLFRRSYVLAVALVALALPAHANAPPVAIAEAPSTAVLGEPLVFRDASTDVDGEIVRAEWEFSDGRTVEGFVVTRALSYAGVHTITLRVQDDAGAWASTQVEVLVRAPLMQGRAVALRGGGVSFADTGDVATTQHEDHEATLAHADHGQLRVAGMQSTLRTLDHRAVARADVGWVYVPLPIGYLLLTGIEAESIVGCAYPTIANVKFSQVRLNDAPLVPPGEVPPNTRVPLPGGASLVLNAQEPLGDRLAVTAARYIAPDGSVLEVARAEAGASHCPWRA